MFDFQVRHLRLSFDGIHDYPFIRSERQFFLRRRNYHDQLDHHYEEELALINASLEIEYLLHLDQIRANGTHPLFRCDQHRQIEEAIHFFRQTLGFIPNTNLANDIIPMFVNADGETGRIELSSSKAPNSYEEIRKFILSVPFFEKEAIASSSNQLSILYLSCDGLSQNEVDYYLLRILPFDLEEGKCLGMTKKGFQCQNDSVQFCRLHF